MSVVLKGESREYRFDFSSTNAMCRIEHATGRPYGDVLKELAGRKARANTIRLCVAATIDGEILATVEAVGTVIDDVGGLDVFRAAARTASQNRRQTRSRKVHA